MDIISEIAGRSISELMALLPRIEALKPIGQQRRIGPRPARGKTYYPNGAREIARRTRQAQAIRDKAFDRSEYGKSFMRVFGDAITSSKERV